MKGRGGFFAEQRKLARGAACRCHEPAGTLCPVHPDPEPDALATLGLCAAGVEDAHVYTLAPPFDVAWQFARARRPR